MTVRATSISGIENGVSGKYRIRVCTANLGATDAKDGHPKLKHCFAVAEDSEEQMQRTWAYGRSGLSEEPYPDAASVVCQTQASELSENELNRFDAAFRECGSHVYTWGKNDCCSCLENAIRNGLGSEPVQMIRSAAHDIAASPEVFL